MRPNWRLVFILLLGYLILALILILGTAHSYEVTRPNAPPPREVQDLWFDTDRWSAIYMDSSMVTCHWDGENLRCIPVPPGSILLLPQAR